MTEKKHHAPGFRTRLMLQKTNHEVRPYNVRPRDDGKPHKAMKYAVYIGQLRLTEWQQRGEVIRLAYLIKSQQITRSNQQKEQRDGTASN